jgi:hypothetical protein
LQQHYRVSPWSPQSIQIIQLRVSQNKLFLSSMATESPCISIRRRCSRFMDTSPLCLFLDFGSSKDNPVFSFSLSVSSSSLLVPKFLLVVCAVVGAVEAVVPVMRKRRQELAHQQVLGRSRFDCRSLQTNCLWGEKKMSS